MIVLLCNVASDSECNEMVYALHIFHKCNKCFLCLFQCIIKRCNISFAHLFGYDLVSEVIGLNVTHLIPSLTLPSLSTVESEVRTDLIFSLLRAR